MVPFAETRYLVGRRMNVPGRGPRDIQYRWCDAVDAAPVTVLA